MVRIEQVGTGWRQLRSFFRAAIPLPMSEALTAVGIYMEAKVRQGIRSGRPGGQRLKANAPATVRKKGSSQPLIEFGTLLRTIQTKRISRFEVFVGIPGDIRHTDARRTVALVGRFHEFLTANYPILPRRQFLEPVLMQERSRIGALFLERVGRAVGFGSTTFGRLGA